MASKIRELTVGLPDSVRTYATPARAQRAAEEQAARIGGLVNVLILPVVAPNGAIRHSPVFACFSDERDIQHVARAGFTCFR